MYAAMTTTAGTDTNMVELARMAGETMAGWLAEVDGFEGMVVLSDDASGTTQVITFWESREVAERHQAARMQLRDRITETVAVEVQETRPYEVAFARFPPGPDAG